MKDWLSEVDNKTNAPTLNEYLRAHESDVPSTSEWLNAHDNYFNMTEYLASRVRTDVLSGAGHDPTPAIIRTSSFTCTNSWFCERFHLHAHACYVYILVYISMSIHTGVML
jgi:hypothetical protein